MKYLALKLIFFISSLTLVEFFFSKENIVVMALLIVLYFIAFAVGDLFSDNNLDKNEVIKGFMLSLLLGVIGPVITFHTTFNPVFLYVSFIIICIDPNQVIGLIQNNIKIVLDKIIKKIFK